MNFFYNKFVKIKIPYIIVINTKLLFVSLIFFPSQPNKRKLFTIYISSIKHIQIRIIIFSFLLSILFLLKFLPSFFHLSN